MIPPVQSSVAAASEPKVDERGGEGRAPSRRPEAPVHEISPPAPGPARPAATHSIRPSPAENTLVLLHRIRRGDDEAFDLLCRRYLPRLKRWATGRLPRSARDLLDTQDIVQETMIRAVRRIPEFEPRHEGSLQAYLRQAILNRIRDEVRRARVLPQASGLDSSIADPGPSPLEEAVGRECADRYERAFNRLRSEDQEAIVLRIELGYSHGQIAEVLDKPSPDAARMAVSRALLRLAQEMRDETR